MKEEIMLAEKVWAVVGANDNPKKYGNTIYKKLKSRGYEVYPVNPNYKEIDGDICYANLSSLPKVPDVIDMVVPPRICKETIEEASKLGIKNIWLQPGTHNEDIITLLEQKNIEYVKACVLVALR